MRRLVFFVYIMLIPLFVWSQFSVYPLDQRYNNVLIRAINDSAIDLAWHPAISVHSNSYSMGFRFKSKVLDYLTHKNNFDFRDKDFSMHLNLLGHLGFGRVSGDSTRYYRNTRGFEIYGGLGEKVFYYTKFLENQAVFVPYVSRYIDSMVVVPGEGWWKHFGQNGRDYTYAMGYLVFQPIKGLCLEIGHGKHFIGAGYRSLILSDNSFVYPYLKASYTKGHFSFVNMWTEFYQFRTVYYFYHYPKHGTFTSIGYVGQKLNFDFIISTIWKTSDYQSYVNRFPVAYFFPVISPVLYGLDGENNVLLALNATYLLRPIVFYGQFVVDRVDLSRSLLNTANRYAYQIGARSYDIFSNKKQWLHLGLLAEYNVARPYTYASAYQFQGFYHYNQPLAHPWGAGFKEALFRLNLQVFNITMSYHYSYLVSVAGSNIFDQHIPDVVIRFKDQGTESVRHNTLVLGLLLNSHTGLRIFYGIDIRDFKNTINHRTFYKFAGLTTDIGRFYYDF